MISIDYVMDMSTRKGMKNIFRCIFQYLIVYFMIINNYSPAKWLSGNIQPDEVEVNTSQ